MSAYKINDGQPVETAEQPAQAETDNRPRWRQPKFRRQFGLPATVAVLLGVLIVILIARHGSNSNQTSRPTSTQSPATGQSAQPNVDTKKASGQTAVATASAIERKQTATIKTYYGDKIKVVVIDGDNKTKATATPSQAAQLIKILGGAQNPWNWDIDDHSLAAWIAGPYGSYFYSQDNTATILTGISANGYVVSILINGQGIIVDYLIVTDANVLLASTDSSSSAPKTKVAPDQPPAAE